MNKKLVFSLIAIILLSGCSFVAPQKDQNNIDSTTTDEVLDISDWKTYRNEEYGFEFKYPSELTIINLDYDRIGIGRKNLVNVGTGYKYQGDIVVSYYISDGVEPGTNWGKPKKLQIGEHFVNYYENVQGISMTNVYFFDHQSLTIKIVENEDITFTRPLIDSFH